MQNLMPPIESLDNLFHDGNPLTGEQGTIVSAKWLNDVQKAIRNNQSEILSILNAAGINVNESNQAQLLDAVKQVIAGEVIGKANSNHNHPWSQITGVPIASTTTQGITKLNSATNSTITTEAATPSAVKQVYDLAASKVNQTDFSNYIALKELGESHLDSIKMQGFYSQPFTDHAGVNKGYPVRMAGSLIVIQSNYTSMQIYCPFTSSVIYIRYIVTNGRDKWQDWRAVGSASNCVTWCTFNGMPQYPDFTGGRNISVITKNSAGVYDLHLTEPVAAHCAVLCTAVNLTNNYAHDRNCAYLISSTKLRVEIGANSIPRDMERIHVAVFG